MSEERVYVIGVPGSSTVKIGRTIDLAKRLADIQRMSPVSLEVLWSVPGGHELETNLHRHFRAHRSHGEWFAFDGDPVRAVREAVEAKPWENLRHQRLVAARQSRLILTSHLKGEVHVGEDDEIAQIVYPGQTAISA